MQLPVASALMLLAGLIPGLLKKLYLTDYAITVALISSPLPPSTQHTRLPQAIPTPLFTSTGHACKFFGYSIPYTVLYIPMAIL